MPDTPAGRLLSLLEVLQARPVSTGAELAEAIAVTPRTLRRYVQRLIDLGIPIESERGPYGGYRLQPRHRLPPLMLTADEAVAVTLGLTLGDRLGISAAVPAASGALAKLLRVLPDALRAKVQALQDGMSAVSPADRTGVDTGVLAELGAAAGRRRQVSFDHVGRSGDSVRRTIDPYGVVFSSGRWYAVGFDHDRAARRTFRLDRISNVRTTGDRFRPPDDLDVAAELVRSLANVPYGIDVEVILHVGIDRARAIVPQTVGTVTPRGDDTLLRIGAVSPASAARHLVGMGVPFTVLGPPEVRDALHDLAGEIRSMAQREAPA